jgi:electron transport complex protein RnfG
MIAPVEQKQTSAWEMYRAIVGIGALCALVIVGVFQGTEARIRDNQERFLAGAIAEVLPATVTTVEVTIDDGGRLATGETSGPLRGFLSYNEQGELAGAVLTAEGMGYQDIVRILYSYSFERNAIVGMKVLETKETPGLGDKIETEPHFVANFEALDASLTTDGRSLRNAIVTVKQGDKTEPWQLDGITGATITSDAIGNMLNESASRWVPVLERDAASIRPEEQP